MAERAMTKRWLQAGLAMTAVSAVLACTPNRPAEPTAGTDPNAAGSTAGTPAPAAPTASTAPTGTSAEGIVTYDGYQTVRARSGDTVTTVAARIGMSATALGAYNGLAADHQLREGDELALPPRPGGYGDAGPQAAVTAPASTTPAAPSTPTPGSLAPAGSQPVGTQPIGTTAPSGAGGIPVASSDLDAPGTPQPTGSAAPAWSPALAEAAIARSTGISQDGTLGPPPSSAQPVPTEPVDRPELESPDLGQYQTQQGSQDPQAAPPPVPQATPEPQVATAAPTVRMRRPVEGPIAVGFNKGSGPARNDGIDFAAPAGAPVVAAADGEVALVSESLGGLGTIVLVRHPNELLTVYGRIDGVVVRRGDIVEAGQQIGVVSDAAAPAEPRMHFEVRRGAESLDPTEFL